MVSIVARRLRIERTIKSKYHNLLIINASWIRRLKSSAHTVSKMRGDPPVPKELMVDDCQCIVSTGHEVVFSISLTASSVIQAKVVS